MYGILVPSDRLIEAILRKFVYLFYILQELYILGKEGGDMTTNLSTYQICDESH